MSWRYYVIDKPYGYLSQFTKEIPEHLTLGDLYSFPKDVYPVGRLDRDSEGLLILTNNKKLNHQLLHPDRHLTKTYCAQVEGDITQKALTELSKGVVIRINKKLYRTLPCEANLMVNPSFPPRNPPIRYRKHIPTTWVSIVLREGKNRQVRKMCAAVGYPVLRLIRVAIGGISLADLNDQRVAELDATILASKLNIEL